jgi:uncharacterized protein (TIGR03435 family)
MKASILTAALCAFASGAFAQAPSKPLTFEVASVKPSPPDTRGAMIRFLPGGGLRVSGVTLKMLIAQAYNVRDFQISGGPSWIASDRFDINARPEASEAGQSATPDLGKMTDEQRKTVTEQMSERLRALLAERFQLVVRHENKEQQVYALVVAKNGPKLHESTEGMGRMRMAPGSLTGDGVALGMLATTLSNQLGRPVVDKTGLTGKYDLELKWTPDPGQRAAGPIGDPPPGVQLPPPPDPNGPSVFTAVTEQLGLRLESQKAPVDSLVIERVEKPSEN